MQSLVHIAVFGVAGAALMAGVGLLRRAAYERRRVPASGDAAATARSRIRRAVVAGWICIGCCVALVMLRLLSQ